MTINVNKYKQILRIQHVLMGDCEHEVKVSRINNRYHVRIFLNGKINQEAVCNKENIGFTCRSLLRWEDKCGNMSKYASSARERHNKKDFI